MFRDGNIVPVPSSEVTVGDVVILDAGDYIPADGRILNAQPESGRKCADRRKPRS